MECRFRIEGTSVILRTAVPADLDDYARWSDPNLKAWQYDGPWYHSGDKGQATRKRTVDLEQTPPYKRLEIETREGVHLGWLVVYQKDNDPHMTEIGIDIVEEAYWEKGLGTEALFLWVDYLFRERGLTRIGFSTWVGNQRMIAVGLKLGFAEECRIRNGCEVGGKFYDRIKMGILREEWDNVRDSQLRRFSK